jgi:hypothetical protein
VAPVMAMVMSLLLLVDRGTDTGLLTKRKYAQIC